jgi:hypothetical protein
MDKKSQSRRAEVTMLFAVVLGLILGTLIKKVRLGILLGLIIGGAIVFLGWIRSQKNQQ